ncbi:MAG: hypothetical protein ACYC91_08425 [Solirubrobacteraceae bacterium]
MRQTDAQAARTGDRELAHAGRGFAGSGTRFLALGAGLLVPGLILFILASGWAAAIGIALMGLSLPVLLVAAGLLLSSLVSGWASRRRPFA